MFKGENHSNRSKEVDCRGPGESSHPPTSGLKRLWCLWGWGIGFGSIWGF